MAVVTPTAEKVGRPETALDVVTRKPSKEGTYLRERMEKSSNRETFRLLDSAGPVAAPQVEASHNRNIGFTNVDETTREIKRSGDQETRFKKAENGGARANDYLLKGIDAMLDTSAPAELQNKGKEIMTQVEGAIRKVHPHLADTLSKMTEPKRAALIRSYLQDSRFSNEVHSVLARETDPKSGERPKIPPEITDRYHAEKENLRQINETIKAKDDEQANLSAELADFNPPSGKLYLELQSYDAAKMASLKTAIQDRKTDFIKKQMAEKDRQKDFDDVKNLVTGDQRYIDAYDALVLAKQETQAAEAAITQAEAELKKKDELEARKKTLEDKDKTLTGENDALHAKKLAAESKYADAAADYDIAKIAQDDWEEGYANRIDNVFEEATRSYLGKRVEEAMAEQEKAFQELIQKETNKRKQDALSSADRRWQALERSHILRKDKSVVNKEQVGKDYKILLEQGADALMDELGISRDDFTEEEYLDLTNQTIAQLLAKRVQTGKVDKKEIELMASTSWGTDALNAFIEKNSETQNILKQMGETGHLKDKSFDKKWLLFILAALGLLGGGVAAIPAIGIAGAMGAGGLGTAAALGGGSAMTGAAVGGGVGELAARDMGLDNIFGG